MYRDKVPRATIHSRVRTLLNGKIERGWSKENGEYAVVNIDTPVHFNMLITEFGHMLKQSAMPAEKKELVHLQPSQNEGRFQIMVKSDHPYRTRHDRDIMRFIDSVAEKLFTYIVHGKYPYHDVKLRTEEGNNDNLDTIKPRK